MVINSIENLSSIVSSMVDSIVNSVVSSIVDTIVNSIVNSFGYSVVIRLLIPQTALALEGFLLTLYRVDLVCQDFPLPPTCLDLPRLA